MVLEQGKKVILITNNNSYQTSPATSENLQGNGTFKLLIYMYITMEREDDNKSVSLASNSKREELKRRNC